MKIKFEVLTQPQHKFSAVGSNSMKALQILLSFVIFIACTNKQADKNVSEFQIKTNELKSSQDTISKELISNNWQDGFGMTHNPEIDSIWFKPVNYYLNDKNCSGLARDFYYGELRPSDNGMTEELLKLSTTKNNKLRPFYRWCLNMTIIIQDGALGEYTGVPARKYAEKFPREFFEYMDSDTSKERYNEWVGSIEYSGFYENDDYKKPQEIKNRMIKAMKANCDNCDVEINTRIEKFAEDCFD